MKSSSQPKKQNQADELILVTEPAKKKLPTWSKILIVIGSIILLFVIIAAIVFPKAKNEANTATEEALQPFMSALISEDYVGAMRYVSREASINQDKLTELYEPYNLDDTCATEWTSFYTQWGSGGNYTDITGNLICDDSKYNISARLIKEGDIYKIRHFGLNVIL